MDTSKNNDCSAFSIFWVFLRLGLSSFGGPIAHIGFFRKAFVEKRQWLSESEYADLVALSQFLPGPSSSQVGLAIGQLRGGYVGAVAAWLGFTLPSALIMIVCAYGVMSVTLINPAVIMALKIIAAAIVANALWGMFNSLCRDWRHRFLALASAGLLFLLTGLGAQLLVIAIGALLGLYLNRAVNVPLEGVLTPSVSKRAGVICLSLFLLIFLPLLVLPFDESTVFSVFQSFYVIGSLVFGGGHVVLPLLEAEVVNTGLVDRDTFLAGYAFAQGVPGPLFSFAAYLGAVMQPPLGGVVGGLFCLTALYLPSFFLVWGTLPFWASLRANRKARAALMGVNAAVVGVLLAAFIDPMLSSIFKTTADWPHLVMMVGMLVLLHPRVPNVAIPFAVLPCVYWLNQLHG